MDIEEHYNFKADGSCSVVYDFDMSKAVSVLMNLMTDSVRSTPEFGMVKDTTLNFYTALPDTTISKMSVDEVNMAKASQLNVNMNLKKNLMKVSLNHEAKNIADLQYYLEHISKLSSAGGVNAITKNSKKNTAFDPQQLISGEDYYVYEITAHKFYRIIDLSKFNAFLKRTASTFAMAKAMLIETPYKVVLNFAKPVKKIDNPKAVLSADRRRVTLQTNMDDIIKNPSSMNLKIDF
ncbi:hypothetical protein GCM10028826_07750 [Mucilaginibacter boryungensis]